MRRMAGIRRVERRRMKDLREEMKSSGAKRVMRQNKKIQFPLVFACDVLALEEETFICQWHTIRCSLVQ